MAKTIIKRPDLQTFYPTRSAPILLIAALFLALIYTSFETSTDAIRLAAGAIQSTGPEKLSVRFQFPASPSFQTESEQELKRAIVFARKRKSKAGTVFSAYILLTNVGANNCERNELNLKGDGEFALAAFLNESFKEKEGPESTAIHRVLFGGLGAGQPKYFFIASSTHRERLKEFVGDVPYHVEPAWPIGWGSRWSVTVIPKGGEKVSPLEVRLEESKFGWTFMLNHVSEKKGWQNIAPKPTTYLVLSRGASGPIVWFHHLDKKLSASGNIPLTVCGLIPEDAPSPFGDQ
jgi:hypothetical protein